MSMALIAPTAAATQPTPDSAEPTQLTQTAAPATALTVSEQPSAVVKGTVLEFAVSTQPSSPATAVRLERRLAPDGDWHTVADGTLDVNGVTTFTAKPNSYRAFDFRVVLEGSARQVSKPQTVDVVATSAEASGSSQLAPAAAVTVSTLPATLPKGETLQIQATTSSAVAGVPARLERRVSPDGAWATVGTGVVSANGTVAFSAKPNSYRAFDFRVALDTAPVSLSRSQTVTVVEPPPPPGSGVTATVTSLPSTLTKGQEIQITATTRPAIPGTPASLERRVLPGGAWSTVLTTTLDQAGEATMTAKPNSLKTFEFRVSVATQPVTRSRAQSVRVVSGVAPGASGFVPRAGALFNNPFGSATVKHRISKRIETAINATPERRDDPAGDVLVQPAPVAQCRAGRAQPWRQHAGRPQRSRHHRRDRPAQARARNKCQQAQLRHRMRRWLPAGEPRQPAHEVRRLQQDRRSVERPDGDVRQPHRRGRCLAVERHAHHHRSPDALQELRRDLRRAGARQACRQTYRYVV